MPDLDRDRLGDEVARRLFPTPDPHLNDPVGWIEAKLGPMWSGQRRIAQAVHDHRHVAVPSAHGVGKDWTAAALACWWLSTRTGAFVMTTAPTSAQLGGILWREVARHHRRAELAGTVTAGGSIPTWRIGGELVGWGRKPADLSDPDEAASAFSGIHARSVLVVLDEASGIEGWLVDAAMTLLTSADSRLLAIGNPLDPGSRFAAMCAPGSGFHVERFAVFDTPAFTSERVSSDLLAVLPSPTWVEERRADWGEGSPAWMARVLGEFPPASRDTLIAPNLIADAQARDLDDEYDPTLGCDVARSGSDRTVVAAVWPSGRLRIVHDEHGQDTMATAGAIARLLAEDFGPPELHPVVAAIDVVGVGVGTFDRLAEQGANVSAFSSASRALDPTRFANRRAEAFWQLREAFESGKVDPDPNDDALAAQLGALRWKVDSSGRVLIESKDAMRARGLPSPDRGDAAAMALAAQGVRLDATLTRT
ncbi:MAG TPA: hypothetical protein VHT27_01270 [Solirubrobacteraceae bacterium]|jgi:hypothetical protein|nr:hypothetical protein [Solirubrobacteraceae bacterium]